MLARAADFARSVRRFLEAAVLILLAVGAVPVANADLSTTVDRVKPSIVAVGVFRRTGSPAFEFRGTGFVVGDGNIAATNAHVVADPPDATTSEAFLAIQVRIGADLQVRRARLLASSPEHDLAVIRFEDKPLPRLALRGADDVREGQAIAFTGFPVGGVLGFSPVTHRGIVSAITPIALPGANSGQLNEKVVRRLRAGSFNILQLDATAYPGNSGSPVFDVDTGEVMGVINMVLVRSTRESALTNPTGIAYAIPVSYLNELLRAAR